MDESSTSKTADADEPTVDFKVPITVRAYAKLKRSATPTTHDTKKSKPTTDKIVVRNSPETTEHIKTEEIVKVCDTDKIKDNIVVASDTTNTLADPMSTMKTVVERNIYELYKIPNFHKVTTGNMEYTQVAEETLFGDVEVRYLGYLCCIQDVQLKLLCMICNRNKIVKYNCRHNEDIMYVCNDKCFQKLINTSTHVTLLEPFSKFYVPPIVIYDKYIRQCAQCARDVIGTTEVCSWEAMDFCNESCLFQFQKKRCAACAECSKIVEYSQQGLYCVRFGRVIGQFCSVTCLEATKRMIRICTYCQKSFKCTESMMGDEYFCNSICKGMYENILDPSRPPLLINPNDSHCFVCKVNTVLIVFEYYRCSYYFCTEKCFTVFKFIQNYQALPKQCHMCAKYALQMYLEKHALHYRNMVHYFCSDNCQHLYIITHKTVEQCLCCKITKYNFDMIQKDHDGNTIYTCSLNCLNQLDANCHVCSKKAINTDIYHKQIADGTSLIFCSKRCIRLYKAQFFHVVFLEKECGDKSDIPDELSTLPVISSMCSLAPIIKNLIIIESPELPDIRNVGTMASKIRSDVATQVEKELVDVELQVELE